MTEKKNSDQETQPLTVRQSQLPVVNASERKLARPLRNLEFIRLVAEAIMDEVSETHIHSLFKTLTTLDTAGKLEQAFGNGSLAPEEETVLLEMRAAFLQRMHQAREAADDQFLQEQQRVPEYLGNDNPIENLWSLLFGD